MAGVLCRVAEAEAAVTGRMLADIIVAAMAWFLLAGFALLAVIGSTRIARRHGHDWERDEMDALEQSGGDG